jgi:hypothetical protein
MFFVCVVLLVLVETLRLRALRSLVVLWYCFLLDRHPFVIPVGCANPYYPFGSRYLVLCCVVGGCLCLLWIELWRGSGERCPCRLLGSISDVSGLIGRCHRGLDAACMCRTGLAANLDRGVVVLGKHAQRGATWHHGALVDRVHPLALVVDVLYLCISPAPWPPRCVWSERQGRVVC